MTSTPNELGEVLLLAFLCDLAHSLVHSEDRTLLRSCIGRDQSGPYENQSSIDRPVQMWELARFAR